MPEVKGLQLGFAFTPMPKARKHGLRKASAEDQQFMSEAREFERKITLLRARVEGAKFNREQLKAKRRAK